MKYSLLLGLTLAGSTFAGCAHPLEKIVEENHQKRVGQAYANRPITFGAGDGIGAYAAQSAAQSDQNRLTMSDRPTR
jgi:hypothetical protein